MFNGVASSPDLFFGSDTGGDEMRKYCLFSSAVFIAFIIVAMLSELAGATPSTQIWIPSTDTQAARTLHVGVDNYNTFLRKKDDGGFSAPTVYGLTAGLVDNTYIGLEAGLDLKEQSDDPLFLNVKLQIKEDSVARFFPAIAIGGYEMGTKSDVTNANIAYVLFAKTLPVMGRLSAGYYVGNEDVLKDSSGKSDNDGILLSFDRTLAEIDDRLWFAVDYMGAENAYGALSFGLSWRFSPQISAIVGYDIYNNNEVAGENTVTVQFDVDF